MSNQGRLNAAIEELPVDLPEATDRNQETNRELPLNETFAILKNERRRRILKYLQEHRETAKIGEIAEHIAAEENGIDESQLSSDQRKRVYISLYQGHLPKMDETGVLRFDKSGGTVELKGASAQVIRYMDTESDEGRTLVTPTIQAALLLAVPLLLVGGLYADVSSDWLLLTGAVTMVTVSALYLYAHFV